jgi:hypothetical protein
VKYQIGFRRNRREAVFLSAQRDVHFCPEADIRVNCYRGATANMPAGLRSEYRIVTDMPRDKVILAKLKFALLAAAILFTTPAESRSGVIKAETYACTSWGAAHEYTLQSLTAKGGQINKFCPIRLPKGTKVDVINDFDDGYAIVTRRGKTWWVDGERVQ